MDNHIFFFVSYSTQIKENPNDIIFLENKNNVQKPECIYLLENFEKNMYFYIKIFKLIFKKEEKNYFQIEYEVNDDKYIIKFKNKGNTFIYDVFLEIRKSILEIGRKINQNIIKHYQKFYYFETALEKNNLNDQIDLLYKDTLEFYLKEKDLYLIFVLFSKIYQNKELCISLLNKFNEINNNDSHKKIIADLQNNLYMKELNSKYKKIFTESEKCIKENNYNIIQFYGIILCYTNIYDYENFVYFIDELSPKYPETLYEIIILYSTHFSNSLNKGLEFFDKFIKYIIKNKELKLFEKELNNIKDLETFIYVIEKNKENIYLKYSKHESVLENKYIIKLDKNNKFKNVENIIEKQNFESKKVNNEKKLIFGILNNIKSIINYSKENGILLIYFNNYFWNYILNCYNESNKDNIQICFELRKTFIIYYDCFIKIFDKNDNSNIKKDIIKYFEKDEFSNILDKMIIEYIKTNNEKFCNIINIAYITKYDPYYFEPKYFKLVNIDIFDFINFDNIDKEFIEAFKSMNFENIFREYILDYIKKLTSKINNFYNLDNVIKLINIKNIGVNDIPILLDLLNKSYDEIIKNEIESFNNKEYDIIIKSTSKLSVINFIYSKKEKQFDFFKYYIKLLENKNIIHLIFAEIIKIYINKDYKNFNLSEKENEDIEEEIEYIENEIEEGDINDNNYINDFNTIKKFIFGELKNKINNDNDICNIINFMDCLEGKFKNKNNEINIKKVEEIIKEFLKEILKVNIFTNEEFFFSKKNLKINLLCKLYEKGKIKHIEEDNEEYYYNIIELFDEIKKELEGEITKEKLEQFLKTDENIIKQKLNLLNLIYDEFNSERTYEELKRKNEEINKIISNLKYIGENLKIYHSRLYKDKFNRLLDIIENYQAQTINQLEKVLKEISKELYFLNELADKINRVKNFLLFQVIYNFTSVNDEKSNFDIAYKKLEDFGNLIKNKNLDINEINNNYKNIINKIKEEIKNSEEKANNFIQDLIKFFNLDNEEVIKELTILFKIKKYELDINSILFLFDNFEKDNQDWNNKLNDTYKNISENTQEEIISKLNLLQKNKIYDYTKSHIYNKLFTILFNKKKELEFLFSKIDKNIINLIDRINPCDNSITIKDIKDTEKCISTIKIMKELKENNKIFDYIKTLDEETIFCFENFIEHFNLIIELDRYYEESKNIYIKILKYINEGLTFEILQDKEIIYYSNKDKNENLTFEELIFLKNKIYIFNENNNKENVPNDINNIIETKKNILIFFKNEISNIEIIYEYMKILHNKGCSLPLSILIKIKINKVQYFLNDKIINFKEIKNFLLNAKNNYITQLNSLYKEKIHLRFLYGKQLYKIIKHLEGNINIESILRFILNNKNNLDIINEGCKSIKRKIDNYITHYDFYIENSFENISTYITSVFINNNKTIEEHYDKIKIISQNYYKGIYLHECEKNYMDKFIVNLFLDKIGTLPGQNLLFANNETTFEEIQCFLNRALLCSFNTLFVLEINDSFNSIQQSMMISLLDELLFYKNNIYYEKKKEYKDKKRAQDYLDSCIVFIYDKENKNLTTFLQEIKNFDVQYFSNNEIFYINKDKNYIILPEIKNISTITSDICGLGKTGKIKKLIKDKNKKYMHFPLGGKLTKKIIYDKLENLLNKIKNENYMNIGIHLDLIETNEISLINEFLFSILITKFYITNENILYIPNDIYIYIEIPNCFYDYLSKFGILQILNKENITLENIPSFNYSNDIINIFDKLLGIKTNDKLQEFIQKNINIKKYSYHQINIFIKLFISQFGHYQSKLKFKKDQKDITNKCLQCFSNCMKYIINGGFSQLLTSIDNKNKTKEEKENIDEILTEIYEKDLINNDFIHPLIFINPEKMEYLELNIAKSSIKEYKEQKYYLKRIKKMFQISNDIDKEIDEKKSLKNILKENDDIYVLTDDNLRKMILIEYKIKANIPVILMGETGCGKTSLIIKLNQLLNNGKNMIEIININSEMTDIKLISIISKLNIKAEKQKTNQLWILFKNMNACPSFSILLQIFITRTYQGFNLNDNIRLIGTCYPYRKRKIHNNSLLSYNELNENLIYSVNPLPQSLLYYVYNFSLIDDYEEKQYIYLMLNKIFNKKEKDLHEKTKEVISFCHIYFRKNFDYSLVSLRDVTRFIKIYQFLIDYFSKKEKNNNEQNNKLKSIICSVYICYYIKLSNNELKSNFDCILRPCLLELINNEKYIYENGGNLKDSIKNKDLKKELEGISINYFSDFLKLEEEYFINQIELDKNININPIFNENIFILFISLNTNIPLIINGKSGSSKSLSLKLIINSMKGKYSKNDFFKKYPEVIYTYYPFSETTQRKDIDNLFEKAEKKLSYYKNEKLELPISLIIFDEICLIEKSKNNIIELLQEKLDQIEKEKYLNFICINMNISNINICNRTLVLFVQDLDRNLEILENSGDNIAESISDKFKENKIFFQILSRTYFEYKNIIKNIKELMVYNKYIKQNENYTSDKNEIARTKLFEYIKESKTFKKLMNYDTQIKLDFHGIRDFYCLIKGIATELEKIENAKDIDIVALIEKYIERNFGGIEYEIDIDRNIIPEDMERNVKLIRNILDNCNSYYENKKINSVYLFKMIYNLQCKKLSKDKNRNLKIDIYNINNYNINYCINSNINDINSRYLLIGIKPSLTSLIYENIKSQNKFKKTILYEGSPFSGGNNIQYIFKIINDIKENIKHNNLIILENLSQIHSFLYELYNMNFEIKNGKKYTKIYSDNYKEQLVKINDRFRIIIFIDKKCLDKCDLSLSFLNRFEKVILSFEQLLDKKLKIIAINILEKINIKNAIKKNKDINYSLRDLLINCEEEEILGLIYYYSKDEINQKEKINAKQLEEKVVNYIYKLLPQDILCILSERNILKQKYYDYKNIFNFNDYINDERNKIYKISVIYTYTSIVSSVLGLNKDLSFGISEIKSENDFKNLIDEIKDKYKINKLKQYNNNFIFIHLEQTDSTKIKFITNFILNNYQEDKYNYIIIVHIKRNFSKYSSERIESFLVVNPNINQIFIDNLNYDNKINLVDILKNDIKYILKKKKNEMDFDEEFIKTLKNFLEKQLIKNGFNNDNNEYINEIINYFKTEEKIKEKIIELNYKLINKYKNDLNGRDLIEEIFNKNYINKYSLDMTSILIEYIKEEIFNKYLKNIIEILEDNNILTTLIEIKKNNYKYISKENVEYIISKFLDEINITQNNNYNYNYKCKFLYNYNIPGFYNFYAKISFFISKNISLNYFNNRKKKREIFIPNLEIIDEINNYGVSLLYLTYKEILNNHKSIIDIFDKIDEELIFDDYINYFMQKYKGNNCLYKKDDFYHKLIELIIKIKFDFENELINNQKNKIIIFLIKIIWIESNILYILIICKLFEIALIIFRNDENKLFNIIKKLIKDEDLSKSNTKSDNIYLNEIDQSFYLLISKICLIITSDKIELTENNNNIKENEIEIKINYYFYCLNEIIKVLKDLNKDVFYYLNSNFIFDELIQIINLFINLKDINKIKEVKNNIKENNNIILKYKNSDYSYNIITKLISKFESSYNILTKNNDIYQKDRDYLYKVKYICFKEIKKINDINYHCKILEKIIEENDIIKISNDIFEIFFDAYLKIDKFKQNKNNILNGDNIILILFEQKIKNNNFVLIETLFYLFEKYSLNYLQNQLEQNKIGINNIEESLKIFEDSIDFLNLYITNNEKIETKLSELYKLFCLSYIKVFNHFFVKMLNEKILKSEEINKIINIINKNNSVCKMILLYIYKIFYNNYHYDFFNNPENINNNQLNKLKDFSDFIQIKKLENIYQIDHKVKTIKNIFYNNSNKIFQKFKNNELNTKPETIDFNIRENGIDNFYILSFNFTLSQLQLKNPNLTDNFYNYICKQTFNEDILLLKAIGLFYNFKKYNEIQKSFNLNSTNIKPILFGYRFCLNELYFKNKNGIYYPLYESDRFDYIKDKLYPGNDTKYNSVYNNIINHFKFNFKSNEGCYVCLCEKWYYHSVLEGFPGKNELNMKCPECGKNIGIIKKGKDFIKVKRNNYFRIFKDNKELEENKKDENIKNKMKQINYMTLQQFQEKFIYVNKGIFINDKTNFKNNNKIVRNLSQVSYRLLNYILYIHLFFARLITNKKDFDNYLPKGMSWIETLNECWNILNKELIKENIDSIEKFILFIFSDLFTKLNERNSIDNYNELIKFENELEIIIQNLIKEFKIKGNKSDFIKKNEDKISLINLLKEKYSCDNYDEKEFPFYNYFYFTNYINENYILEQLEYLDENKYPMIKAYIENKNNNNNISKNDKYSLNNLLLFNNILNLIKEEYFNNISKETSQNLKLKDTEIYLNNKDSFNQFFKFYNNLGINSPKGIIIKLSENNSLNDFFIDDNNYIGRSYKMIYNIFIKEQNEKLEKLLNLKIKKGIFDIHCKNKINIQEINEDEIFNLNLPKSISFIDIIFNSSYRKIIDTTPINYKLYKEYEINFDLIEEKLTELLLKNKKLLNDYITEFIYNKDAFTHHVSNKINLFKEKYKSININEEDEKEIVKFYQENKNHIYRFKSVIKDFMKLINLLNIKKEKNFYEETKIYEIISNDEFSTHFKTMFENKNNFTINKLYEIFNLFLKLINEDINKEIKKFQDELNEETKDKIIDYFKKEHIISKNDFFNAIRLFISLVLFLEEDKRNKIQNNNNNLLIYLKALDFWKENLYINNNDFVKNFKELQSFNIKVNQTISLYNLLANDFSNNKKDKL